jgi:hypothetical protein
MAAPVYLPADPEIGAAAVPAVAERHVVFVKNTALLLREQHPGPAWPAVAAWSGLTALLALWVYLMALSASRFGRAQPPPRTWPEPPRRAATERMGSSPGSRELAASIPSGRDIGPPSRV